MRTSLQQATRALLRRPIWVLLGVEILAIVLWQAPHFFWVTATLLALALLAVAHGQQGRARLFVIFLLLTIAALATHTLTERRISQDIGPKSAQYTAVTTDLTIVRDNRTAVVVDLRERLSPVPGTASGRVRLTIGEPCAIPYPSQLTFSAAVHEPRAYKNPGVFDYRQHLRRENVWGQAFVATCAEITATPAPAFWWQRKRQALYALLSAADLQNGPALSALLLGTRSIQRDEEERIRDAGLSHLFAISGMQFAVMSALVFGFVSLLTRIRPSLYLRWPRQKIASLATLAFIGLYLLIVSPQPSILRAGIMIATYLMAVLIERQKNLLHVILVSMAILLLFRPLDLFQVSFQLSYLCVLILALIADPLFTKLRQRKRYSALPRPLTYACEIALTSWLLSILLLPLILHTFGETSLSGLIHNLWAVPYFDFVITPLSLLYFAATFLSTTVADTLLPLWDASLTAFHSLLAALSPASSGRLTFYPPHAIHLLFFYGTLLLYIATRRRLILAVGTLLLLISLAWTYYDNRLSFDLRITQIDVGQGDAILIETPDKTLLVDAGGSPFFDIGKNVLKPYLQHRWIGRIDAAIITHADTDHYLGFQGLLDTIAFGEVWISGLPGGDPTYEAMLKVFTDAGVAIRLLRAPFAQSLSAVATIRTLWPQADAAGFSDNDNALVFRIEYGDFSALLTGDIGTRTERRLLANAHLQPVDLLKVAHHGSRSSSHSAFLATLSPQFAFIGAGEQSRFGHPHSEVIKRLRATAAAIYRTDRDGTVTLTLNGKEIRIETYVETDEREE